MIIENENFAHIWHYTHGYFVLIRLFLQYQTQHDFCQFFFFLCRIPRIPLECSVQRRKKIVRSGTYTSLDIYIGIISATVQILDTTF